MGIQQGPLRATHELPLHVEKRNPFINRREITPPATLLFNASLVNRLAAIGILLFLVAYRKADNEARTFHPSLVVG